MLYRPRFFDPVVFDRDLLNATVTGDDLLFRLATFAKGVKVVTACVLEELGGVCEEALDPALERKLNGFFNASATPKRASDVSDLDGYNFLMDRSAERAQRRRGLKGSGKADSSKEVSLANKFNAGGGNNKMWADAVALLKARGVLDFDQELQRYAPSERRSCIKYMTHSRGGLFGSIMDTLLLSYQGMYDKECGIWTCQS